MMKRYLLPATPLAAMLLLTGCMDDNYDLSNIDTTTEVKVNDLTIPVNLEEVKLDALIDLDEDGDIKKELDPATGKMIYVYSYEGSFDSDAINIDPFRVTAPVLTPNVIEVHMSGAPAANAVKKAAADAIHYTVKEMETQFDYQIDDIDPAVKKISDLSTPKVVFSTELTFPSSIVSNTSSIHAKDLKIQFPKGMTMAAGSPSVGKYDATSGIVTIADYEIPAGVLKLVVTSTLLSVPSEDQAVNNGSFTFKDAITVLEGGELLLTPKAGSALDPDFSIDTDYQLSSFTITAFSGALDKPIDGLAIDPISLDDMPDFLTGEGTNLVLANPQLYLELNNPVSQYNLEAHTGLFFSQVRPDNEDKKIVLPGGLTIGCDKPAGASYQFALSPQGQNLTPIAGYENAEKVAYPGLGEVLAGNGLPEKLNVEFTDPDPNIFGNNVKNFPLDGEIKGIKGNYEFRAPLALEAGSKIMKSGTESDWSSEDLDRLEVKEVQLAAVVNSQVPVAVQLSAKIIDTEGNHIGRSNTVVIPAMAENYDMVIKIESADPSNPDKWIKNIDGIFYDAICEVNENDPAAGQPLSPEQAIVLKNVRAKVTGRYLYEDKDDDK